MQSIFQNREIKERIMEEFVKGGVSSATTASVNSYRSSSTSTGSSSREKEPRTSNRHYVIQVIGWDGPDDPLDPRNWPLSYRCWIFVILWINVFAVAWASSADSQAGNTIAKLFGVSEEVESLSPSLYTLGIAIGALFAGPISEAVGRNPVYVFSRFFHVAWLLGASLAPNIEAQCCFRLLAGLSGSAFLALYAASIADLFGPLQRTLAWPLIALASFLGTAISPLVGAWIEQSSLSWRWIDRIALILSGSTLLVLLCGLPETFSPIILRWKAAHLRLVSNNASFKAELDLQDTLSCRLKTALRRSRRMVTRELVVSVLGAWLALEAIVVSPLLQGFSYIFEDTYSFSRGLVGTSFAALALGGALWTCSVPVYYHLYKRMVRKIRENYATDPDDEFPDPEYRFWPALLAVPALPIGLFWLSWTNYEWISPWSNLGALVLLGFAWAGIYATVHQYILDVYSIYAGSALAIITSWRYFASGVMTFVSRPMYNGIGVHWTMTMLGCFAALLTLVPLLAYKYGTKLRIRSVFADNYSRPDNVRERIGRAAGWAHYCTH